MSTAIQQAPKTTAVAVRKDIREVIQSQRDEIAKAIPRHMNADRMIRVMLTAINTTPKLMECTRESLLSALMKCSQYGLEPDGRHAHLIPFKKGKGANETHECQLIFDYKGLVNLVRRSGDITDIHCDVVYEKDDFEFSFGTNSQLRHRPNLKEQDRGAITCAYSFVKLKDGSTSYEVMPWWEIEAVKENSQGFKAFKAGYTHSNPWDTNWAEMAKKTAFRRHTKWLPLSFEVAEAIGADDDRQDDDRRFANAKSVQQAAATMIPEATETKVEVAPPAPPQNELGAFVESSGFDWPTFKVWAEGSGNMPEGANWTGWNDVPDADARRFLRSKAGLTKGLSELKAVTV